VLPFSPRLRRAKIFYAPFEPEFPATATFGHLRTVVSVSHPVPTPRRATHTSPDRTRLRAYAHVKMATTQRAPRLTRCGRRCGVVEQTAFGLFSRTAQHMAVAARTAPAPRSLSPFPPALPFQFPTYPLPYVGPACPPLGVAHRTTPALPAPHVLRATTFTLPHTTWPHAACRTAAAIAPHARAVAAPHIHHGYHLDAHTTTFAFYTRRFLSHHTALHLPLLHLFCRLPTTRAVAYGSHLTLPPYGGVL